jgi:uncharacterized membrane protein
MATQEQSQAIPPALLSPRALRGGQHVSGDLWGSAFEETGANRLATFLGWVSVGLGLMGLVFPETVSNALGARRHPLLTRAFGLRDLVAGAGILSARQPIGWMKARVAGDVVDLAMLLESYGSLESRQIGLKGATVLAAGVTTLDILCIKGLSTRPAAVIEGATRPAIIRAEASMAINKAPEECYRFWRSVENLPRFMKYLESVDVQNERASLWRLRLTSKKVAEWECVITSDTPNEEISWQSVGRTALDTSGMVRFEPRLSGPGAIVRVAMQYTPPAARFPVLADPLIEIVSEQQLKEDLRRLKSLMETGEIPTVEGQPSGRR